jgi:hypothetical protein
MTSNTGIAHRGDLNRVGASVSGGLSATGVSSDFFIVRLIARRGVDGLAGQTVLGAGIRR